MENVNNMKILASELTTTKKKYRGKNIKWIRNEYIVFTFGVSKQQ